MNYREDYWLHKENTCHSDDGGRCCRFYSGLILEISLFQVFSEKNLQFVERDNVCLVI